jgi:hypothetical protein
MAMNSLSQTNVVVGARSLLNRCRDEPRTWFIALIVGLLHAVVAGRYDAFRNELYFIVCGRHPDFGFVDQPPLVPLLAAVTQLFGDMSTEIRLVGVGLANRSRSPPTSAPHMPCRMRTIGRYFFVAVCADHSPKYGDG